MSEDRVPEGVRSFLRDHIRSLEQLETLLLVRSDAARWWSAEDVARELRTSATSAAHRLEEMAARSLLEVRIGEPLLYRYAPASRALDVAVGETAQIYRQKPVTVTTAIYSQPVDEIQAFADSFRIRRKDGDGG